MKSRERIEALREIMKNEGVACLLVVSDDYHQSEYVGDYFKSRAYISGFTGSAGSLVVFADEAKLFTDGRYFIQAEKQLSDSGIDLMRSGTEGTPTVPEYIISKLKPGDVLAFDGKCVSAKSAEELGKKLPEGAKLRVDTDFPGMIWEDRPPMPSGKIWSLDVKYAGKSHAEKLVEVRKELKDSNANALVLSSLCDIAWLYNLRGSDVENTPVFMSYSIITPESDTLYANLDALSDVKSLLNESGVTTKEYSEFYEDLKSLTGKVMADKSAVNSAIVDLLGGCEILDQRSPTVLLKAKKNEVELEHLRRCHIADGLSVTKLMLELKYGDREFDEVSVDKYLLGLRKEAAEKVGVTFLGESFDSICAFGPNGAIIHYSAEPESCAKLDKTASIPLFMVDSGGQYLEGTTDITRTIALGELPDFVKKDYSMVAVGMLRLLSAVFMDGCAGSSLDVLCRQPFWERGVDYLHGTGHGVGYLNSVHEGPNRFHFRAGDKKLEVGMITTDEPGYYVEGSHGIRIENELCTVLGDHTEYGQLLKFENLTFCPIDSDAIDVSVLEPSDKKKYNAYQKAVFEKLSPYLCASEREKLAYLTREI